MDGQWHRCLCGVIAKLPQMLQVHDEVILEGPKATAAEAQQLVIKCMQYPFQEDFNPLHVALVVDSKIADTWYEAK